MPVNWDDVRYRGDALDVEELTRTYRVNDYLDTFEENRRQAERKGEDIRLGLGETELKRCKQERAAK